MIGKIEEQIAIEVQDKDVRDGQKKGHPNFFENFSKGVFTGERGYGIIGADFEGVSCYGDQNLVVL